MRVLPEGEQFVGTHGGGMDHAAILASHAGHALHIQFNPFVASSVAIPQDWQFLVGVASENGQQRTLVCSFRELEERKTLALDLKPDLSRRYRRTSRAATERVRSPLGCQVLLNRQDLAAPLGRCGRAVFLSGRDSESDLHHLWWNR